MADADPREITRYLQQLDEGDDSALDELLPHVYADLRQLAEHAFRDQWRQHTLQPTALVHEAYLRLAKAAGGQFENRRHFLRVAALAMRQLLTDYARQRNADKREGKRGRVVLDDVDIEAPDSGVDLLALDEALDALRELDERQAQIVELRFLTGLSVPETAEVLGVSERTVFLDWKMARAWLERRLASAS